MKQDESNAKRNSARVCKVNEGENTLHKQKDAIIGIKTWSKMDFLPHYCGWTLTSGQ